MYFVVETLTLNLDLHKEYDGTLSYWKCNYWGYKLSSNHAVTPNHSIKSETNEAESVKNLIEDKFYWGSQNTNQPRDYQLDFLAR